MRWRAWIWLCVSLACFFGAAYFWRLADEWEAQKAATRPQQKTNAPAVDAPKPPSHAQLLPNPLLSSPGNLNYQPPAVAASTNRAPSPLAYRLTNTTRTIGELARSEHSILLQNALLDTTQPNNLPIPDSMRAQKDPGTYIVQSRGPLDDAFRSALKSAGAAVVTYIPNNAYLVRASDAVAQQLAANPQTQTVLPYEPYYKLKPSLLQLAVEQRPLPDGAALNLLLFADARQEVLDQLQKLGANVLGEDRSPFGPVVKVQPDPNGLTALAALSGVHEIEFAPRRILANDLSRVSVGVAVDSTTPTNYLGLTGSGITVAVNDSGIDATHPDLKGRVSFVLATNGTDVNGHGTHVAGIIAGDGTQSGTVSNAVGSFNPGTNGQYRGKAPKAALFSQQFTRADYLLQEAAARTNALISNNSWAYTVEDYDLAAASYDAAVRDSVPERPGSQAVVYVFPAGNNGAVHADDSGGNNNGTGGAAGTITSPGTAKNVITVGAVEQNRNITNSTYSCVGAQCTTNQPWLPSSDSSNQVAGFSSRGNVGIGIEGDFGRFKPDVVAPGTVVVSTRSAQWDEAAYYNPTNYIVDPVPAILSLILTATSAFTSTLVVSNNAVEIIAYVTPPQNLPVFLVHPDHTVTSGIDQVAVAPSPPETEDFWRYGVSNNTLQSVAVDLHTILVTTNNTGNFLDELKTNLNAGVGPFYRYESGTSMAAADVSGTLALMEEFFTQRLHLTNSPAMMKALLINGARTLGDIYDFGVTNGANYQGWGQINLPTTLQGSLSNIVSSPGAASSMLLFDQDPINSLSTGRSHTRNISLSPDAQGQPLRITLVWTDPPADPSVGTKLVNDLDLVVTNLDTGDAFFGNDITPGHDVNLPLLTNTVPTTDFINNVENVYLNPNPALGTNYSVTVIGHRVNVNAVTANPNDVVQDYALVISSGDGLVPDALTLKGSIQSTFVTAPNVLFLTNTFPLDPVNPMSGGLLVHQHVGANTPLLGTNTVPLPNDANAVLTVGMTNQWHFYMLSNDFGFTNLSVVTFLPPELAVPRMGVTNVMDPANANRLEADIDLFMSTDPGLTNLSPTALLTADKSNGRGGTEFIVKSNATQGTIYYVGVKSEDQQSAEYSFLGVFSEFPPTTTDTNGNRYLLGLPVPAVIPSGSQVFPKAATVLALDIFPTHVRRVIVTNILTFPTPYNLIGILSHGQKFATLNNHTCITDASGICLTNTQPYIYEDNGEGNVPFSRHSDGPGSLTGFIGEEGLGVWTLNEVNNYQYSTGRVDRLYIKLEPQNLTTNGVVVEVLPNTWYYDSIDVPGDATNLTVCVSGNTATLDLYVRRDLLPTTTDFDYHQAITRPGGCLPISVFDNPPLIAGRYFIGVFNSSSTTQKIRVTATIFKNPSAVASSIAGFAGPVNIQDDAITYAYITNLTHMPISSLDVGLLISDPRISDLALTLISPNGTRILLFENRGALSTNGLGTFSLATNSLGVPSYAVTNLTAFYTNDFDDVPTGPYVPGAVFDGWNVLSNKVIVYPDLPAPWLSNNVLILGDAAVSNSLPTTNSTSYSLSFRVTHAPYLVGMVGWWPLDSDASDIFNGLDGLLFGNVLFNTSTGEVNHAFFGDGLATRMVVPRGPELDLGTRPRGFSIEGWINPAVSVGSTNPVVGPTIMADSFENFPPTFGLTAGNYFDGWHVESGDIDIFSDLDPRFPGKADTGDQYLDINGFNPGVVSTNIPLTVGRSYRLSFAFARNPNSLNPPVTIPQANVNLNGTTLMTLAPTSINTQTKLDWQTTSVVFTATAPVEKLQLQSLTPGQNGVFFDSFKVVELVSPQLSSPLVEWYDTTNLPPLPLQGVQFWVSGLPGTNVPGTLWANIWDTNSQPHLVSTAVAGVTNAGWQHVALTYDAATFTARIYLNSQLLAVQALTGANIVPRTSGDLYFGYHPDPGNKFVSFQGGLDEFSVYERPLTDCEIAAIVNAGTGGKYGTNVLGCPVVDTVQLINAMGSSTVTFTNGLTWTNGPQWETNTITFNNLLNPAGTNGPGINFTSIILSDLDPNATVDEFILSAVLTNYLDGLMHFTDNTNVALVPIKYAPAPYAVSNFPPTVIFSNNVESAPAGLYQKGAPVTGSLNNPAYGARDWTVLTGPITVLSNTLVNAAGTNSVALAGGGLQCLLPTAPGHRYQVSYSLRGPGAVSWWTGDINPLDDRAWDLLGGNDGAFIHQATNSPLGLIEAPASTNTLVFPGWIDSSNTLASKIELGDPENLALTNSFTIEGWIKPDFRTNPVPETIEQILFRGDSRDCQDPYWFGTERVIDDQLDLVFHIQDAGSPDCGIILETAFQPIQAGQWQHVAAVFEANVAWANATWPTNELRLYVNGQQLTPDNNAVYLEDPANADRLATEFTGRFPFRDLEASFSPGVAIGNRSRADNSEPFYGAIDELSVYGRALTGPEIAAIYTAGSAGKADFRVPPALGLAKLSASINDVEVDVGNGDNSSWTTRTFVFTADRTNSVLKLQSLLPGTIVSSIQLTELPPELNYLPEESLSALNGEDAYGTWTLEIWDNRVGGNGTNLNAALLNWQLNFVLLPSNAPPVIELAHGIPYTNTIVAHGIQNFVVNVPQWATNATNVLLSAVNPTFLNPLPVGVLWSLTNQSPSTTAGAVFWPPRIAGSTNLSTNALVLPYIVPGQPYFLTVTNPNPVAVSFAYGVWFDIISLTNCQPFSNFVWQAGIPRYFQFDVPTNTTPPGAPPQEVSFLLTGVQSNFTGLGSNLTVVLSEHLPLPDLTHYDYIVSRPSTNNEVIMVVTNSTPFPVQTNRWYVGVFNDSSTNVPFNVQACYTISNYPVIIPLTNDVPFVANLTNQFVAPPGPPQWFFFEFQITNQVDGVLFEMYNLSGNADLVLQRDVPPGTPPYFDGSFEAGAAPEQIVVRSTPDLADIRGNWYLGVLNNEATNVAYTLHAVVRTNGMLVSAQPLVVTPTPLPSGQVLLQWNSVIGEFYVVKNGGTPVRFVQATTPLTTALLPPGTYTVEQISIYTIVIPQLTIQLWTNNMVRISWPVTFPGILQYAYDPAGPWADLNLPVVVEGADFVVYDVISSRFKYYRLIP
jgi:subtilisin-like proprotein convertase family protein